MNFLGLFFPSAWDLTLFAKKNFCEILFNNYRKLHPIGTMIRCWNIFDDLRRLVTLTAIFGIPVWIEETFFTNTSTTGQIANQILRGWPRPSWLFRDSPRLASLFRVSIYDLNYFINYVYEKIWKNLRYMWASKADGYRLYELFSGNYYINIKLIKKETYNAN